MKNVGKWMVGLVTAASAALAGCGTTECDSMYDIYDITMTRDFPFTPEEASTYTYTVCSYDCTKVTPSVAATADGKARVTLVFPVGQSSKTVPVKLTVESGIPFTGTTIIAQVTAAVDFRHEQCGGVPTKLVI